MGCLKQTSTTRQARHGSRALHSEYQHTLNLYALAQCHIQSCRRGIWLNQPPYVAVPCMQLLDTEIAALGYNFYADKRVTQQPGGRVRDGYLGCRLVRCEEL
jgi:hypothetical protein